ncbi:MAG TPA: GNAT family N-acetyltransferase [Actinomycetota bacterium]|nr:GNAT family N-acetyltransferase [Actinomycetota bacterium]
MSPIADEAFVRGRTSVMSLRDGSRVKIRPVLPGDKQRFLDGFARLSPASRYRRFLSPIDELTPEMLRIFTEVDYRDHFAYVALLSDEPNEPGIGVARYVRVPDDPVAAEAAVTVIDEYQGRGLGTLLLEALGAVALENGIRRFSGVALAENAAIREVLESMGARVRFDSSGLVRVEVDLPATTARLTGTPLYDIFRTVARGEGPAFLPPPAGRGDESP